MYCSIHITYSVHGNSIVSTFSLYFHFITEKKRARHRSRLLTEFLSYWVFLVYIFSSLCGWCVIFLASFILVLVYFSMLCIKLIILNLK
jgi:hypothetical protein